MTTAQILVLKTIVKEGKSSASDYDKRTVNALLSREYVKTDTNRSGWQSITATAKGKKALN